MKVVKLQELDDLVDSQKYFFKIIFKEESILDVNFEVLLHSNIVNYYNKNIKYDSTEYDLFGDQVIYCNSKYSVVYSFEFCHFTKWREYLKQATKIAKKYILVEIAATKNHDTIDDIDICYYYHPFKNLKMANIKHEKVPFIIHNLDDLISFCEKELPVKAITVYIYNIPKKSNAIYPIPEKDLLKGGMLLEIGEADKADKKVLIK